VTDRQDVLRPPILVDVVQPRPAAQMRALPNHNME